MAIEGWALVELMGHGRIAGRVSEETIVGAAMLRVDVPKTRNWPAYTRYFSAPAIYAITPTDEFTAQAAAEHYSEPPVQQWILPSSPLLAIKITSGRENWDDPESIESVEE